MVAGHLYHWGGLENCTNVMFFCDNSTKYPFCCNGFDFVPLPPLLRLNSQHRTLHLLVYFMKSVSDTIDMSGMWRRSDRGFSPPPDKDDNRSPYCAESMSWSVFVVWESRRFKRQSASLCQERVCVGCVVDRGHLTVLFRKTILPKDEWVNRNH